MPQNFRFVTFSVQDARIPELLVGRLPQLGQQTVSYIPIFASFR